MDRYERVRSALLERDQEVGRLRAAVHAGGERAGEALVVEGAPGIGKSRLLAEVRAEAEKLGLRVLAARGTELERAFPYGVMRQLFERLLTDADEADRERWLAGAAGLASELLTGALAERSDSSPGPGAGDASYAWQHGLYWLASNLSSDTPLVLLVDDVQWSDLPSLRALMFIARRLDGQPLTVVMAMRPADAGLASEAAALAGDPAVEVLRPSALTEAAVAELVTERLFDEPSERFVRTCIEVTGGNPFYLGELLGEIAARGLDRAAAADADIAAIVPRGVANAVLLRLARLAPPEVALARALSVLGDGALGGDAASLAGVAQDELEGATSALISVGIAEGGASFSFAHPILRAAIYDDLSAAERERLHSDAAAILRARGAPPLHVAAQVMHTEPAADGEAVALLRAAAREALGLGDAAGAALLLARALDEPPPGPERAAVVLELGQAHARAGSPEAVAPLSEIVEQSEDQVAIAAAAIELGGMLFFAGRVAEGADVLRRAQTRVPAGGPPADKLEVALLGVSSTSASARVAAEETISALRDTGRPAQNALEATTLATLAMDDAVNLRPAARVRDLAERAMAAGLPLEPHRGENWALLALGVLGAADGLDAALRGADEILAPARKRGAALTVVTVSSLRALICFRRGEVNAAEADAHAAIELGPTLLGARFLVLAVAAAILAGLERGETPESMRRLIERAGVWYDDDFTSGLPAPLRLGHAPRGGGQPRGRGRGAARVCGPAAGVRRREPRAGALALCRRALPRGARAARGGARAGRRRGAAGRDLRSREGDRRGASRARARRPRGRSGGGLEAGGRGARGLAGTPRARAGADRPRCGAACGRQAHRGARAPARRARHGRALRWRCARGAGALGARRGGRAAPHDGPHRGRVADAERAARRAAGRRRLDQPGDRTDVVRHGEDGGDPSRPRLPQARHLLSAPVARRARRRRGLEPRRRRAPRAGLEETALPSCLDA